MGTASEFSRHQNATEKVSTQQSGAAAVAQKQSAAASNRWQICRLRQDWEDSTQFFNLVCVCFGNLFNGRDRLCERMRGRRGGNDHFKRLPFVQTMRALVEQRALVRPPFARLYLHGEGAGVAFCRKSER